MVNPLRVVLAVGLALAATFVRADNDAANGRLLYLGLPSASHPAGSTGCISCHNVNDTSIQQNRLSQPCPATERWIELRNPPTRFLSNHHTYAGRRGVAAASGGNSGGDCMAIS